MNSRFSNPYSPSPSFPSTWNNPSFPPPAPSWRFTPPPMQRPSDFTFQFHHSPPSSHGLLPPDVQQQYRSAPPPLSSRSFAVIPPPPTRQTLPFSQSMDRYACEQLDHLVRKQSFYFPSPQRPISSLSSDVQHLFDNRFVFSNNPSLIPPSTFAYSPFKDLLAKNALTYAPPPTLQYREPKSSSVEITVIDPAGDYRLTRQTAKAAAATWTQVKAALAEIGAQLLDLSVDERRQITHGYEQSQPQLQARIEQALRSIDGPSILFGPALRPCLFPKPCTMPNRTTLNITSSATFRVEGTKHSHLGFGGSGGINVSPQEAIHYATWFSKLTGGHSVDWVYDCSHSAPVDTAEAIFLNHRGFVTKPAQLIADNWLKFYFDTFDHPNAFYIQLAHSKGVINTKLALHMVPEQVRQRVIVIAIAPAAVIPEELCKKAIHYASKRDIVPFGEIFSSIIAGDVPATIENIRNSQL